MWLIVVCVGCCLFFKPMTAYEVRISDWSSDVCSSDLLIQNVCEARPVLALAFIMAVVAAVLTLSSSAVGEPALQRWLLISIYLQWIGICSAATLCWARRWLRYARAGVVIFVCWGMLVVINTVISVLTYRLSGYTHWKYGL